MLTLPICLEVVWASPQFLNSSYLTQILNQFTFKISALICNNFGGETIMSDEIVPQ